MIFIYRSEGIYQCLMLWWYCPHIATVFGVWQRYIAFNNYQPTYMETIPFDLSVPGDLDYKTILAWLEDKCPAWTLPIHWAWSQITRKQWLDGEDSCSAPWDEDRDRRQRVHPAIVRDHLGYLALQTPHKGFWSPFCGKIVPRGSGARVFSYLASRSGDFACALVCYENCRIVHHFYLPEGFIIYSILLSCNCVCFL